MTGRDRGIIGRYKEKHGEIWINRIDSETGKDRERQWDIRRNRGR